jgi:DNA-binding transcriptional LysR family regulator
MGYPVTREHFALRTDDLIAAWEAVRAGLGVGFAADYTDRTDPAVQRCCRCCRCPACRSG